MWNLSIVDTIKEVSLFQSLLILEATFARKCPDYRGVIIREVPLYYWIIITVQLAINYYHHSTGKHALTKIAKGIVKICKEDVSVTIICIVLLIVLA